MKIKNKTVVVTVALVSAFALGACSTAKKSDSSASTDTGSERYPAQASVLTKTALDDLITKVAQKNKVSEDVVANWIKTNADNLKSPGASKYEFGAGKLTVQEEDNLALALSKSSAFKMRFKVPSKEMDNLYTAYKTASTSAKSMSTTGKTTYSNSMSTIGSKSNVENVAPNAAGKSKLGTVVDDAIIKIKNPQTRELAVQRLKLLEEVAVENPELKEITANLAADAAVITAKTDRQVFGVGCKNAADHEAFTNLDEALKLTKKDLDNGMDLDPAFQKNLAKVTENDVENICPLSIKPLSEVGGTCQVLAPEFALKCK